ncbi:hypothetical protein MHPYR_320055 [uncultured Mycobacterium sp.]|uniref:Uncharacterized protein n=1 Tax=uncultured Mycobacterium sp. TaxID=171292 RepID=A0A1Y5PCR7_9MYCO|nr:hypothetical protein MHPYR_300023 [uncultured Mycobacterium sp.]SBS76477.1 hypothetical protein MHPYR_320055 [uncultured Mycobacterium sp.]
MALHRAQFATAALLARRRKLGEPAALVTQGIGGCPLAKEADPAVRELPGRGCRVRLPAQPNYMHITWPVLGRSCEQHAMWLVWKSW